ncbi:MAG TPA: metalloregulator ArsR/SmtB family transcription factor [Candidatus Rifleibacterium sp.]|nr:metalloregulator ArsR/SmtB family transcription factor [Candidatus Rifleibacterium sp.]
MKETLNTLKVLAEESRLRIFMALNDHELCVCQIVVLLGLAASTTSKHLALMYQAGVIDQRKVGRWAYYRVSKTWKQQHRLSEWLVDELADSEKIAADRERLEKILAMPLDEVCNFVTCPENATSPGNSSDCSESDCC